MRRPAWERLMERLESGATGGMVVFDMARFSLRDQLTAAAYESDRLSKRVKRGKRVKATHGELNHSRRPFGFE